MPIHASSFSPDGTIVALVHGPVVTLWDVESNVMLRILDAGRQVDKCLFVGDRYLVAAGQGLVVWDLLSCQALWATTSKIDHIALYNTSFAAFTSTVNETIINIYYPSCSTPSTTTISVPLLKVVAFRSQFIGVAPSGEIFRFGKDVISSAPATNAISTSPSRSSSIWQEMFGKDAFLDDLAPPQRTVVLPPTIARPTDIFDGPSHTLPPVGLMFDAFMSQLLKPKSGDKKDTKSEAIVYEANGQEEEVIKVKEAIGTKGPQTKKVTEQDMRELESFFKDVLSSTPAQIGLNQSSQKMANGNGHRVGGTPKSTPVKASSGVKAVNGDVNETPTEESREKKHTKKRRAPKE